MRVQNAGQYGGLLHNFLAVLIYRLADLAQSQRAVAFVISAQEPRRKEEDKGSYDAESRYCGR